MMPTSKGTQGATSRGSSSLSNYNPYTMTSAELRAKARTYIRRGKRYWLPKDDKKFPNVYTDVEMETIELCNARKIIGRGCNWCVNQKYCANFKKKHGYLPLLAVALQKETEEYYRKERNKK